MSPNARKTRLSKLSLPTGEPSQSESESEQEQDKRPSRPALVGRVPVPQGPSLQQPTGRRIAQPRRRLSDVPRHIHRHVQSNSDSESNETEPGINVRNARPQLVSRPRRTSGLPAQQLPATQTVLPQERPLRPSQPTRSGPRREGEYESDESGSEDRMKSRLTQLPRLPAGLPAQQHPARRQMRVEEGNLPARGGQNRTILTARGGSVGNTQYSLGRLQQRAHMNETSDEQLESESGESDSD